MQLPSAVIDRIKLLWQCSPITTKTLKILCQALEALRLQRRQSVFAVWLRIMHFLSQQDDQAEMTSHNCSKSKFLKTKARFGRLLRPLARKRNGSIMEEKGSKGKEEYLYSACYILCIFQSAQAWITQFYLKYTMPAYPS